MKVSILYNGIHPSPTPMSKRLGLYEKGLQEAGVDARIVASHIPAASSVAAYINPFIIPFKTRKDHHQVLRSSDIILVDGFNWFSYIWFWIWYSGKNRKLIYELNEKPGSVYMSKILDLKPVKALGLFLFNTTLKCFDGFVVISDPLVRYLDGRTKRTARVVKLPIIIDTREPYTELPEETPPHPYIIHTGALSQQKDGIIDIFKAFAKVNAVKGKSLHFYLAGSKNAPPGVWDEINRTISEAGLEQNVHHLGLIQGNKLKTLQKNCLFLVLPKPDNEQNRYNFPTKLGEYLTFCRPVIVTAVGDMAKFMKDGANALIVEPGNVEQITAAMLKLMDNQPLASTIGAAGKRTAEEEFDYRVLGQRLSVFLHELKNQQ